MFIVGIHCTVLLVALILCCLITFFVCKLKECKYRVGFYLLLECYILVMIKVVIMPIFIMNSSTCAEFFEHMEKSIVYNVQIIPLRSILNILSVGSFSSMIQIVGNIILLMPIAFIVVWLTESSRKWFVVGFGLLITILIEAVQYVISITTMYPCHAVDIDDIILNYCGYLLAVMLIYQIKRNTPDIFFRVKKCFVK